MKKKQHSEDLLIDISKRYINKDIITVVLLKMEGVILPPSELFKGLPKPLESELLVTVAQWENRKLSMREVNKFIRLLFEEFNTNSIAGAIKTCRSTVGAYIKEHHTVVSFRAREVRTSLAEKLKHAGLA